MKFFRWLQERERKPTMAAKQMKKLQAISLILGLALFSYLIYSVGASQILRSIQLVGSGFIVLIFVSGVRHLLRAVAWKKCFETDGRRIGLFELFNVRLAGEAIRYVSFTGPLLGEPAKAALIRKRLPMSDGLSSVIVENMTYTLGAVLITVSGMALLLANFTLNSNIKLATIIISLSVLAAVIRIQRAVARRDFALRRLMKRLERATGKQWFADKASSVERVEDNIYNFYHRRERTFIFVLLIQLAAQFVNVIEIYLILRFMGVEATLMAAFIIEAAMKLVNFAFFFVPGQVGVFEGGNALLLRLLGLGATTGIALALVEKIRALAWVAYGFIALSALFKKNSKQVSSYEESEKTGAEILV